MSVQGRWNTELEIVIFERWTTMEWCLTEEKHKAHLSIRPQIGYWKAEAHNPITIIRDRDTIQSVVLPVGDENTWVIIF